MRGASSTIRTTGHLACRLSAACLLTTAWMLILGDTHSGRAADEDEPAKPTASRAATSRLAGTVRKRAINLECGDLSPLWPAAKPLSFVVLPTASVVKLASGRLLLTGEEKVAPPRSESGDESPHSKLSNSPAQNHGSAGWIE